MKAWTIAASIGILIAASLNLPAFAGANDFFGSSLGGGGSSSSSGSSGSATGPVGGSPETQQGGAAIVNQTSGGNLPSQPNMNAPSGDFTSDEKRVQKKYRENVHIATKLIIKGEAMMRSKDEKEAKKGKILKEIGERRLAELKQNNPFPELAGREPKKVN